ncbi:MAG TPA: AAA-associated domain-containing protein, partial [Chloroflexota bacterium]|nr:AAA-associated domain-containing protein [Chloroflexota bacterium]
IRVELAGLPVGERQRQGILHERMVDTIYRIMTNPREEVARLLPGARAVRRPTAAPTYQVLPHVSIGDLAGLLEWLESVGGREDLARVAENLQLEADELLPLADAADLLGLGDVEQGDLFLTADGQSFVAADVLERKEIFRRQALGNVELIGQIVRDLDEASDHSIPEERLLRPLEHTFSSEEARRQLETAVDWGRYAELFAFDDHAGEFYLETTET